MNIKKEIKDSEEWAVIFFMEADYYGGDFAWNNFITMMAWLLYYYSLDEKEC